MGDLDSLIANPSKEADHDEICIERDRGGKMYTDEWDYIYAFPRKFLFMSDDDIRSEIKAQIKKTKENAIKDRQKFDQEADKKKNLAAAAAKKLTKEERTALGIK